jgi:hypothetical protein
VVRETAQVETRIGVRRYVLHKWMTPNGSQVRMICYSASVGVPHRVPYEGVVTQIWKSLQRRAVLHLWSHTNFLL